MFDSDQRGDIPIERKKFVDGKLLRFGHTTGSCATAAAQAATLALLTGTFPAESTITTPRGVVLTLPVLDPSCTTTTATCAIAKDGGDDPDATHGMHIYATVTKCDIATLNPAFVHRSHAENIAIDGGFGIGRVTRAGLDQPIGNAAINSTPRRMIATHVHQICEQCGYTGGILVTIHTPMGEKVGAKTFNPHLGIVGGISILGTSGIVEPMSEQALMDSTRVELNMLRATGRTDLFLTIGNYGDRFAQEDMGLSLTHRIKGSNFLGATFADAIAAGFTSLLLVGHIGKMVKLGAGLMNTHSAQGDARIDVLISCALEAGAPLDLLRQLLPCATTDAALDVLVTQNMVQPTMDILGKRIHEYLRRRIGDHLQFGVVVFTQTGVSRGILCECGDASQLISRAKTATD